MTPQPDSLRTKRLVLRRWRDGDMEAFRAINTDPEVARYFPTCPTPEESDELVQRLTTFTKSSGIGPWAVEVPGEASFIGFVGCWPTRPQLHFAPAIEIGWRIDKRFWGRGYAPEGAQAAIEDAFERLNIPEVVAYTTVANEASRRVMEKVGMTRDSADDFDHFLFPAGHPLVRHVVYRINNARST